MIRISAARVAWVLFACALLLQALSAAGQIDKFFLGATINRHIVENLSVSGEATIPAWYSSMMMLLSSLLLAAIASEKRRERNPYRWHWAFLSFTFLMLSMDEAVEIHELSIRPLRDFFDVGGLFYFAWVIPATVLVVLFGIAYLRFLRDLPRATRYLLLSAAGVFLAGALGVEMLEAGYAEKHGQNNVVYVSYVHAEEFLELMGMVLFIYALLRYIKNYASNFCVEVI